MSHVPALSVVTATFNRADRLKRLLAALDHQTLTDFEVVVVDDCSTDQTWQVLQDAQHEYAWLRPLRMARNGGPARARNTGWRAASGKAVVFTDDDCVPEPTWAALLLAELNDPDVDIVLGATVPDPLPYRWRGPFDHSIRVERQSPMFETCNLGIRRDLLVELQGFDESFPMAFGEDADLGWRALERGARTRFVPEARVTHDVVERSFAGQYRGERRRVSLVTAVRKHPGLREHLWHRWFYDQAHERLLLAYALAGCLLARPTSPLRWAAAVASLSWYGRLRFLWSITDGPRTKWPLWMTQLAVLDTVDIARMARQSARERTLVL